MTAWQPRYSFPWIRGQKFQANEEHSIWVFVLKTVAHSAGSGMEVRETLSGVRSLPKEAGSVCTEYITPVSGDDRTWACFEVHWNQWEPGPLREVYRGGKGRRTWPEALLESITRLRLAEWAEGWFVQQSVRNVLLGDQIRSSHIQLQGFKHLNELSGKYLAWLGNAKGFFGWLFWVSFLMEDI